MKKIVWVSVHMKPATTSAAFRFHFLGGLLAYNLAVFALFLPIYLFVDFDKHFASDKPVTLTGKMYFALVTHSNAMSGDIIPKTDLARGIMAAHILLTWLQILFLFFDSKKPRA